MVAVRQQVGPNRAETNRALVGARLRVAAGRPRDAAVIGLQRAAGNAAVNALMMGRFRAGGGEARAHIDAALGQVRSDNADVGIVEKGLREAKAVGIPVDLEGLAQKPPASALSVAVTGFDRR